MSGRIEGKIALVVGAAQGIGEAIAKRFVEEGAKVVIADVLDEVGQATAERLSGIYVHTDISDFEAAKVAVKVAVQYYGTLDIIVQNAGIYPWTLIENTPPEEWDQVCAVNSKGTFLATRAALPVMKKSIWSYDFHLFNYRSLRNKSRSRSLLCDKSRYKRLH